MPLTESTPRLLVVDDEPLVLEIVERFARQLGFEVAFRSSGREALACFPDVKPDIALVDLRMPGFSGIDMLRAIRTSEGRDRAPRVENLARSRFASKGIVLAYCEHDQVGVQLRVRPTTGPPRRDA